MNASRRPGKIRVLRLSAATVFLGGWLMTLASPVAALGQLGPDPNDDNSHAGFRYVVSATSDVQIYQSHAKIFYDGPRQSRTITVQGGNACTDNQDEGLWSKSAGANHTQFRVYKLDSSGNMTGGAVRTAWGVVQKSGSCGNVTINIPAGTWAAADELKDYDGTTFGLQIVAEIRKDAMWGTQNAFRYNAPGGKVGLTPRPAEDTGVQQVGVDKTHNHQLRIPMRTPCELASPWHRIDIYDPDNGKAGIQENGNFTVRVQEMGYGFLSMAKGEVEYGAAGGTWKPKIDPTTFVPGEGSNVHYYLRLKLKPDKRYRIYLSNVYGNNTLQAGIPFDSATYDLGACDGNPPEGEIGNVTCPAGQENAQRIIVNNIDDKDGDTRYRIKIGSWTSVVRNSDTDPWTYNLQGDDIGLNFADNVYKVVLQVRDRRGDGTLAAFQNVAEKNTQMCSPTGASVYPKVRINQARVEVGSDVTGWTGYTSTFSMPTATYPQHGIATRQYDTSSPYIAYTSRMWLDNGDRVFGAGDQEIMNDTVPEGAKKTMASPASNATLKANWKKDDIPLDPLNDPRYKVCISIKIDRAWYRYRDQTVTGPDWVDHDGDPDTPDIYYPPYGNGFGAWQEVDIPGTDKNLKRDCRDIEKWPSMEVQDGDIDVGGVFPSAGAAACNPSADPTTLGVIGHSHTVEPTQRGSKSEYGIIAAGSIVDFGSNDRLATQAGSTLLDFANVGGLGSFYGSGASMTTGCFIDAFGAYPGDAASPMSAAGSSASATANGQAHYDFSSSDGTLTIGGGQLSPGTKRVIRVTESGGSGNQVVINSDITFSAGPYSNIDDLPQFVLLVDGDIDIRVASNVKTLSGFYVTRGAFLTCHELDMDTWNINLDSTSKCRDRLEINGSIMAGDQLLPYRTNAADATYRQSAELFRLRGDVLLSEYAQKRLNGNLHSAGEMELPARF